MLNAIRLVRNQPPTLFSSPLLPYHTSRRRSISSQPNNKGDNMEQYQTNNLQGRTGDAMADSFGEGYATRSEDEGFGGIYGRNDLLRDEEGQGKRPENPPAERDVIFDSFGEEYATRTNEEGFGGIYGGNDSIHYEEKEGKIHGNHPEYDKSQGSEVAEEEEEEKARHQKPSEC